MGGCGEEECVNNDRGEVRERRKGEVAEKKNVWREKRRVCLGRRVCKNVDAGRQGEELSRCCYVKYEKKLLPLLGQRFPPSGCRESDSFYWGSFWRCRGVCGFECADGYAVTKKERVSNF